MTNKDAFVGGIRLFCKRAGFDAEDVAQVERVLFMPPEQAEPIVKAASITLKRVGYVRAGNALEKLSAVNVQEVLSQLQGQGLSPSDLQAVKDWASKQEQAAQLQQAQKSVTEPSGSTETPGAAGTTRWFNEGGLGGLASRAAAGVKAFGTRVAEGAKAYQGQPDVKWKAEYEKSPLKGSVPWKEFAALRGMYEGSSKTTPQDAFIGGMWAAKKHKYQRRTSRSMMRGFDLDMAPGQLAGMTDAAIAERSDDPGTQLALRNARDLARSRQRLQGGVAARMGTGLGTGAPAEQAAAATASPTPAAPTSVATPGSMAPEPETTPTPSSVPQTSVSPNDVATYGRANEHGADASAGRTDGRGRREQVLQERLAEAEARRG